MIHVKIFGGLGNQLFQYALGRSVSLKKDVPLELDVFSGFQNDFYKRSFELANFNIEASYLDLNKYKSRFILKNNYVSKIFRRIIKLCPMRIFKYIKEKKQFHFSPRVYNVKNETYFDGYWQNLKYFDHIRDVLSSEIVLRPPYQKEFLMERDIINNSNSVAIHLRFPHAFSGENMNLRASEIYKAIGQEYYAQAISLIREKVQDPRFFVFSNNIDWAKKILDFDRTDFHFVNGQKSDAEDFELMKNCQHFIISNSTFSWWAAYLACNNDKVVVCPEKWFNQKDLKKNNFFPTDWILLK